MVDVKQAVSKAIESAQNLYEGSAIRDLLLEEVELSEDGKHWLVTIAFSRQDTAKSTTSASSSANYERAYKMIKLRADTGDVVSMKIRKL